MPGMALSYLGDGIAVVAVVLLAQELTSNAALVGLAVTMASLPGAVGAMALGRWLSGRSGAELARWDATWRFFALGAIPLAYAAGVLSIGLFIGLLAAASLLHSWGSAGRYTMIAEILPRQHHLAGNSLLAILSEIGTIAGPPVAALLLLFWNPAGALAIDALSFGVLALAYRSVRIRTPPPAAAEPASRTAGLTIIAGNPALLGLVTLSVVFFFLFGPVYVALPTLLSNPDGTASLLALYYSGFGIGAVLGGVLTPYLRDQPLWRTTVSGVLVVGLCLLPLGTGAPTPTSIICFALAGVAWAPYQATSMALYQRIAPAGRLAPVLAAESGIHLLSAPAGIAVGGLLVEAVGARNALLACAAGTITLALTALAVLWIRPSRRPRRPCPGPGGCSCCRSSCGSG